MTYTATQGVLLPTVATSYNMSHCVTGGSGAQQAIEKTGIKRSFRLLLVFPTIIYLLVMKWYQYNCS